MTREELKAHCKKEIEMCEFWAIGKGEKPSGKIYEEHKLILELLEQEPILDKIIAEIEQIADEEQKHDKKWAIGLRYAVKIIDKYKVESGDK